MPIPFTCPHCGTQTSVGDRHAGQAGPCASCGQVVTIPGVFSPLPKPYLTSRVTNLVVLLGVAVLLLALLLPAVRAVWAVGRQQQCRDNLKQISLALHNYHDAYGAFPPAVTTDEQGVPRYSWRVAILPFLEQGPLYDQWNPREAWDSPNNRPLGQTSIPAYRCPNDSDGQPWETSYVMITGKQTVGNVPNTATRIADITDGTANTIMIVELTNSGIGWSEPRDFPFEQLEMLLYSPTGDGLPTSHTTNFTVAFADGSVQCMDQYMALQALQAASTKSAGDIRGNF